MKGIVVRLSGNSAGRHGGIAEKGCRSRRKNHCGYRGNRCAVGDRSWERPASRQNQRRDALRRRRRYGDGGYAACGMRRHEPGIYWLSSSDGDRIRFSFKGDRPKSLYRRYAGPGGFGGSRVPAPHKTCRRILHFGRGRRLDARNRVTVLRGRGRGGAR